MKKFFTIALILISISVSAQATFTYKDVGGTIGWYDAADAPASGPGVATYKNYIVAVDGYVVPAGVNYVCLNFTIEPDVNVLVDGELKVLEGFELKQFTSYLHLVGVEVGTGGHLWLSETNTPIIKSYFVYDDELSKVSVGSTPSEADFNRMDPSTLSGKGTINFTKNNEIYILDIKVGNGVIYEFIGNDIVVDGTYETIIDQTIDKDLTILESVTLKDNAKLTIESNVTCQSVTVNKGSILVVDNVAGGQLNVPNINVFSDASGQGLIKGSIDCNAVTARVAIVSTSDAGNGSSSSYREIGIPFSTQVSNVNWGEYDSEIKSSNSKHRHSFTNSTARFVNSEPTDNVMGPQEVWLKGGSDIIEVTGKMSDMHNVGYTETLYNVADINGTPGYNMLINPSLAAYDLRQLVGDNIPKIKGVAWLMTKKGDGTYGYVEFIGESSPQRTISPFQAFWVEYNTGGNIFLDPKYQTVDLDVQLNKKESNTSKLKNNIRLELLSDNGSDTFLDNIRLFFSDDISLSSGAYDVRNIRSNVANGNPSIYMNYDSNKLIYKEFKTSDINSGSFVQPFSMVGGENVNCKIQLTNNDLGEGTNVYLTDKETGMTVRLNDGPYSFTHTATSTYPTSDRFEVKITAEALGESERIEAANIKLINRSNSVEFIMPTTSAIESIQFVNFNGQVMKTVNANNGQTEFDVADLNKGIFIAQLKLKSGNVASFKFVR